MGGVGIPFSHLCLIMASSPFLASSALQESRHFESACVAMFFQFKHFMAANPTPLFFMQISNFVIFLFGGLPRT
jgi:hypothetical protein